MGEQQSQLSRAEVERILRRATEFAGKSDDLGQGISERALVEAAEEAGIPAEAVRRAIAIERIGPPPPHQGGDRLVGPRLVVVDAELDMPVAVALDRLEEWLVVGHHLRGERRRPDSGEWRRRDGLLAGGARAVRSTMGEGGLSRVPLIAAVAREQGRGTLLRVTIDRHRERGAWAGGGAGLGLATTAGAAIGAPLASPLLLLAAPVGVGAGLLVARAGRRESDRLAREVRRILDAVAADRHPTTIRQELTRAVRRRPGSRTIR